jgi:hypothetical protein
LDGKCRKQALFATFSPLGRGKAYALSGVAYALSGIADTLSGIADTLSGIADTLSGIADTLNGIADTLNGIADTLFRKSCRRPCRSGRPFRKAVTLCGKAGRAVTFARRVCRNSDGV